MGHPLRFAEIPAAVGTVAFARAALFRGFGVVAAKVVLGIAVDRVHPPLGEHEVNVGLFVSVGGLGVVDGPLVGVAGTEFLGDEAMHQGKPLRGGQFAGQRDFHFPVGRAVGPFVSVGGSGGFRGESSRAEGPQSSLDSAGLVVRFDRFGIPRSR